MTQSKLQEMEHVTTIHKCENQSVHFLIECLQGIKKVIVNFVGKSFRSQDLQTANLKVLKLSFNLFSV